MLNVRLTLDYACCHCRDPIAVTVQCSGPTHGADLDRLRMAVAVPCPHCRRISQICFDPVGTVHTVEPYREPRRALEPSLN